MKNSFYFLVCTVIGTMLFTACLNDDDNSATAESDYYGICSSVNFTDSADTVFEAQIYAALASSTVKLIGSNSQMHFEAEVETNSPSWAMQLCNQKAVKAYVQRLDGVTRYDVVSQMIQDSIPVSKDSLDGFTINLDLYNAYGKLDTAFVKIFE